MSLCPASVTPRGPPPTAAANMAFGEQLKKLRQAAGQTVDQAAKAEGVSLRLWAYWEANQKLPPPGSSNASGQPHPTEHDKSL